jgi:hypothetical protein
VSASDLAASGAAAVGLGLVGEREHAGQRGDGCEREIRPRPAASGAIGPAKQTPRGGPACEAGSGYLRAPSARRAYEARALPRRWVRSSRRARIRERSSSAARWAIRSSSVISNQRVERRFPVGRPAPVGVEVVIFEGLAGRADVEPSVQGHLARGKPEALELGDRAGRSVSSLGSRSLSRPGGSARVRHAWCSR